MSQETKPEWPNPKDMDKNEQETLSEEQQPAKKAKKAKRNTLETPQSGPNLAANTFSNSQVKTGMCDTDTHGDKDTGKEQQIVTQPSLDLKEKNSLCSKNQKEMS